MKNKSVFSAILGNLVEYYDYALYGFLATEISQHFFPASTKSVELMQAFAVFALGSIAKPLGALVFSKIGDGRGRTAALRWNMIGIAIPTCVIGLLPSYDAWGLLSPFLLIICRLMQGFFVGGEADGVRIYVMEHVGQNRRCFANGLGGLTSYFGIYIASYLSSVILNPSFTMVGWQWLFIFGGIMGVVILIIRQHLHETPEFVKAHQEAQDLSPLLGVLKKNKRVLLATILLTGTSGGIYYFIVIFLNSYLSDILGILSAERAAVLTSYVLLGYMFSTFVGGFVTDYLPKMKVVFVGSLLTLCLTAIMWQDISSGQITTPYFIAMGVVRGFFKTPIYPMLLERIPTKERYRTIGIGHPIGSMLFSSTTPFIATFLFQKTQNIFAPLAYFAGLAILNLCALLLLRTPKKKAA